MGKFGKFLGNVAKVGGFGLVGRRLWERGNANKELNNLLTQDPTYKRSEYPGKQLGLGLSLFNSRMAGAPQLERNILSSQGNTLDFIKRGATDASQALSLASQSQGQTSRSLSDLQTMESQNKYSMLDNLNRAYGMMRDEDLMEFQDKIRKFGNLSEIKGAQVQNQAGISQDLLNMLTSIGSLGMGGGFNFGGMMRGGGSGMGSVNWGSPRYQNRIGG